MKEISKKVIVIISPEPWGISFLSKHHYAVELSKGNKVYYINPGNSSSSIQVVSDNLTIVNYKKLKGVNKLPPSLRRGIEKKIVGKILTLIKENKIDIVWSFDPFSLQNLKFWKAEIAIYHAMDNHLTKLEKEVADNSDFIFAPSKLILNKFKDIKVVKNVINHGLSDVFINESNKNLAKDKTGIKVGYVGNLSSFAINFKILYKIVKQNPKVEFNFIGPIGKSNLSENAKTSIELSYLLDLSNVVYHGVKSTTELASMIGGYQVFLLCYDADPVTISNSHKIIEYLSTGSVLVSNYIDEYADKPELVEMCEKIDDLPSLFKRTIQNYSHLVDNSSVRIDFAKDNSYARQIERIEKIICKK